MYTVLFYNYDIKRICNNRNDSKVGKGINVEVRKKIPGKKKMFKTLRIGEISLCGRLRS